MLLLKKVLLAATAAVIIAAVAACGIVWYWARAPLDIAPSPLDVTIKPHSSLRSVALQLHRSGVPIEPRLFVLMTRVLGLSLQLKSGNYAFSAGITPYGVLQKVARGDVNQYAITIIEGWTFRRMRDEINANPMLRHDSASLSDAQLMHAILAGIASTDPHQTGEAPARQRMPKLDGARSDEPEGLFFPDTYLFDKHISDLDIFRRAYRLMHLRVQQAWDTREPGLPYTTPYDALKMASIIEKETGHTKDRPRVAAVFVNRLRLSMPLQTDPTVIYGLGACYGGRLRKRDLQTDTPYNTYMRGGLPPTPIALPGNASLQAALHPAASGALYFVARGDGRSHFSDNLGDHNKAVDKYIRGQ